MWTELQAWLETHETFVLFLVGFSIVTALISLAALPWVLIGLPRDYFVTRHRTAIPFAKRHPWVRWTLRIAKSSVGFMLMIVGLALLVLPGQGLLMILAGLVLAEFPGKRALERSLARRERVMRAMNWARTRAGRPPFDPPERRVRRGKPPRPSRARRR